MELDFLTLLEYIVFASATQIILTVLWRIYIHPLTDFPGPKWAAATDWYKTYEEVFLQRSWCVVLEELHKQYGPIVRVGPNELDFKSLKAYNDIYNSNNRWDKDAFLYRCFGEDHSSFGFLTYEESKERKDILNPFFSYRAICNLQDLIWTNVNRFCEVLKTNDVAGKSSDLYFGFRCYTVDVTTSFCFAKSVNAIAVPEFKAPIVKAMDASSPALIIFKHFSLIRQIVLNMPPWLSVRVSPQTSGLIDLQQMLIRQINEVVENPSSLEDVPHNVIYRQLLNKDAYKNGRVPARKHLAEEAQSLVFAGTDTTGNTLMVGTFHLLANESLIQRLKDELQVHWPDVDQPPRFEDFQKLPFLTAVIKECLRVTPGVTTPLTRIIPDSEATIDGSFIPGGTTVGMSGQFVHTNEEVFKDANKFDPDRWLQQDSAALEKWLIPFSKGPRSCMGQNLAWCELYFMFASLFRRFDMKLDNMNLADLKWRDTFLPHFQGRHLQVFCKPVAHSQSEERSKLRNE